MKVLDFENCLKCMVMALGVLLAAASYPLVSGGAPAQAAGGVQPALAIHPPAAAGNARIFYRQNFPTPSAAEPVSTTVDLSKVQGVNTEGTVRTNNLANLEALLNIGANGGEVGSIIWGLYLIVTAFTGGKANQGDVQSATRSRFEKLTSDPPVAKFPARRLVLGIFIVSFGLLLPGMINWIVASSRDVALCG